MDFIDSLFECKRILPNITAEDLKLAYQALKDTEFFGDCVRAEIVRRLTVLHKDVYDTALVYIYKAEYNTNRKI